jgi:mRNA interferase MazF
VFAFGSVVLARLPFTDLSGEKRRPAAIAASPDDGLKLASIVGFDKPATLDRSIVTGKRGEIAPERLARHEGDFLGVFGSSSLSAT